MGAAGAAGRRGRPRRRRSRDGPAGGGPAAGQVCRLARPPGLAPASPAAGALDGTARLLHGPRAGSWGRAGPARAGSTERGGSTKGATPRSLQRTGTRARAGGSVGRSPALASTAQRGRVGRRQLRREPGAQAFNRFPPGEGKPNPPLKSRSPGKWIHWKLSEKPGFLELPTYPLPRKRAPRVQRAWLRSPSYPPRLLLWASWVSLRPLVGIPLHASLRTWNRTPQRLLAHWGCPGSPLWPRPALHSLIKLEVGAREVEQLSLSLDEAAWGSLANVGRRLLGFRLSSGSFSEPLTLRSKP